MNLEDKDMLDRCIYLVVNHGNDSISFARENKESYVSKGKNLSIDVEGLKNAREKVTVIYEGVEVLIAKQITENPNKWEIELFEKGSWIRELNEEYRMLENK